VTAHTDERGDVQDDPEWPGATLVTEVADELGRERFRPGGADPGGCWLSGHTVALDDAR
jgi:hypothetical protein